VTALLHYGSQLQLRVDDPTAKRAIESIGAHATRGGWITINDINGQQWSLLISPGVPIWISADN
jgi:hypothetical protein